MADKNGYIWVTEKALAPMGRLFWYVVTFGVWGELYHYKYIAVPSVFYGEITTSKITTGHITTGVITAESVRAAFTSK